MAVYECFIRSEIRVLYSLIRAIASLKFLANGVHIAVEILPGAGINQPAQNSDF